MRCAQRGGLWLLATVALVVGACVLVREVDSLADRGLADPPLVLVPLDEEQQEQQFQAESERTEQRILGKIANAREYIAGHLSLREAAARFQELDAGKTERELACWRGAFPAECRTDEERHEWAIVRFVTREVRDCPQQAPAVRRRLAAELPDHLRSLLEDAPAFP